MFFKALACKICYTTIERTFGRKMNREFILEACFILIKDNGIENFSMRKLATRLECQPSTIYHYFKDKQEILNEVFLHTLEQVQYDFSNHAGDLEKTLFDYYMHLYEKQEQLLFYRRYRTSSFISSDTSKICQNYHSCREEEFKVVLSNIDVSGIGLYLMIMGPINELISNPTLDSSSIAIIAKLVARGLKGESNE